MEPHLGLLGNYSTRVIYTRNVGYQLTSMSTWAVLFHGDVTKLATTCHVSSHTSTAWNA